MFRSLCALVGARKRQPLVGTYRLVSRTIEIDGEPVQDQLGKGTRGYIIITPKRFTAILTAEKRKFGTSAAEKAALWETLLAYSGPYRLEANKLITEVEISWNESWNGTKQVRFYQLEGSRLTLTTERRPYFRDPSKMYVARVLWERIE